MTDASQNPAENQPQADDSDLQASANAADATPTATADSTAKAAGEGAATADNSDTAGQAAHAEDEDLTVEDKLLAKVQELTEDLQRVTAEFANYRKRVEREIGTARESGKVGVVSSMLTLADDVERARQHGDITDGSPLKAFTDKFNDILKGQGVIQFGEVGEPFDANRHSAIQDEGGDGEKVLSTVLRKGFNLGDRVLREAMVIVRGDEGSDASAAHDSDGADGTASTAEKSTDSSADTTNSGDSATADSEKS